MKLWIAFSILILYSNPSFAKLGSFSPAAVERLQLRLQSGGCQLPDDREFQTEVCKLYGNPRAQSENAKAKVTQRAGVLSFKVDGIRVEVARAAKSSDIRVNGVWIRSAPSSSALDYRKQIESALARKASSASVIWLFAPAYAGGKEVYASTLIHQLATDSTELGVCAIYADFGRRCAVAAQKAVNQMMGEDSPSARANWLQYPATRAGEMADLLWIDNDLIKLRKQISEQMIPGLDRQDLAKNCSSASQGGFPPLLPLNAREQLQSCAVLLKDLSQLKFKGTRVSPEQLQAFSADVTALYTKSEMAVVPSVGPGEGVQ